MEDALRRQFGVKDVQAAVQTNLVMIEPTRDRAIDFGAIAQAIKNAGFTPAEMTIAATGAFEGAGGGVRFRIRGWPEAYPVDAETERVGGAKSIHARVDYSSSPPRLRELN